MQEEGYIDFEKNTFRILREFEILRDKGYFRGCLSFEANIGYSCGIGNVIGERGDLFSFFKVENKPYVWGDKIRCFASLIIIR